MKKALLTTFSLICAISAQAEESLTKFLIQENITLTEVSANVYVESKPDRFKTKVEFNETAHKAEDAQLVLNKKIEVATMLINQHGLKYELGNFRTHQEYKSKKYKAYQHITIETSDKRKLEKLTTLLQKQDGKVQQAMSFISPESKQAQQEKLFDIAYEQATKKAEELTKKLKGSHYTITHLNQYSRNNAPIHARAYSAMEVASAKQAEIQIDDSDKKVSLELRMNIAIHK